MAFRAKASNTEVKTSKGLILSISSGIIMGIFYRFIARTMPGDLAMI
jgi:hypothetical protein